MNNNKTKRIMAIIGIVILLGLYITALLLAVLGDENSTPWFMAAICATIIVPILIWIYQWLYKLLKKDVSDTHKNSGQQ